jgi:hypothetical protein
MKDVPVYQLGEAAGVKPPTDGISLIARKTGIPQVAEGAAGVVRAGGKAVSDTIKSAKSLQNPIKSLTDDLVPSADRVVNYEVTRALDLTQGDVKNISRSTGNEVGQFIADNNLIGKNKEITVKNLDDFYKTNYESVRTEIAKVNKSYTPKDVPVYKEALTEIKKKIEDVAGLQEANKTIDTLIKKKKITLEDVQKAKELMDEHFSLYKLTGDVQEGVAKKGLSNVRGELKKFIESEVKKETGVDVGNLNNNVSTARSIKDAIEVRSTRGLTRSNISPSDIGTFLAGSVVGTPLVGVAAVLVKKIYQSPSFKLKVSKYLDGISDAKKLKLEKELKAGNVPKDLQALLDNKSTIA